MRHGITSIIVAAFIIAGWAGVAHAQDNSPPAEPQAPPDNAVAKKGFTGSTICKSLIFDCDKPIAFTTLPIGNYCSTSAVSAGRRDKLLFIEGDQATVMVNPRTQKAVACVNSNAGKCSNDPLFLALGENLDGSTHIMVVPGGDGLAVSGRPGALFAKTMENAATLSEVVVKPVTESCDVVLKGVKDEAEKTGFPLPSMNDVDLNGVKVPVSVAKYALEGNRAILLLDDASGKKKDAPQAAQVSTLAPAVVILTFGNSKETTTRLVKPFPNTITGYNEAIDLAVTKPGDKVMTIVMSLAKGTEDKMVDVFSCGVSLDEQTPMTCEKQGSGTMGDKGTLKTILSAKLKEMSRKETNNEDLGAGLADIVINKPLEAYPEIVMHKFEGFSDVPNSIFYDQTGGHVYRLNPDKAVTVIADELLPSAEKCVLADLDDYAGKDLACLAGNKVFFVPKRNLAPAIDVITVDPAAGKSWLSASVKTQEEEELTYKWSVYEVKGGALIDHSDLISDATTASPELNMGVNDVTSSNSVKATHVDAADLPNININAAITKTIKSVGQKDATGVSEGGYFAVLTVKDAGGMSDTALVPLSTNKGLSATVGPGTFASMFAMEGCSLSEDAPVTSTALLIMLVLLVLPLGLLLSIRSGAPPPFPRNRATLAQARIGLVRSGKNRQRITCRYHNKKKK